MPECFASETIWTEQENKLLVTFVHHSMPGGLNKENRLTWRQIAAAMNEISHPNGISERVFTARSVNQQYINHIRPKHETPVERVGRAFEHARKASVSAEEAVINFENAKHTEAEIKTKLRLETELAALGAENAVALTAAEIEANFAAEDRKLAENILQRTAESAKKVIAMANEVVNEAIAEENRRADA